MPAFSVPPGVKMTLHGSTRAQMLKALLMGPNVPAIRGIPVELNHHRLRGRSGFDSEYHEKKRHLGA